MVSSRRLLVLLVLVALIAVSLPLPGIAQSGGGGGGGAPPFYYRVTNGETVQVLQALVDGQSAVDFYGYSSGDSSSHTGYEASQTLSIFLWSGPEGKSLVFMADKANDGTGGRLKVAIDGLPSGASWTVKDDPNDIYTANSADWSWISCCTDGGVLELATNDAVALNLTFPIVSGLSVFRLFGGPASEPQFVTFDPAQPVVIETFQTPGAPGLGAEAGPGVGEVTLEATPPEDDGGDPVTSYNFYRQVAPGVYIFIGSSNTTTFLVGGLGDGTTHTFVASAVNRGGSGPISEPANATTIAPPGAPRDVVVTPGPGAGALTVTWKAPANDGGAAVLGYRVVRDAVPLGNRSSGMVDDGLAPATAYTYAVRAYNMAGEGDAAYATGTTHAPPTEPLDVTVETVAAVGELHVAWAPPADDGGLPVGAYAVYRDGLHVGIVTDGVTYHDTGLANGTTYTYAVAAINDAGEGPASSAVSGTTADRPAAPTGLTTSSDGTLGTTRLAWEPAADNGAPISHYTVYAGDDPSTLSPIASVNATAFEDATSDPVPLPEARHYAVAAINVVGEGPLSAVTCGVYAPYGPLHDVLCG